MTKAVIFKEGVLFCPILPEMLVYASVGKGALQLSHGGAKLLKLETVVGLDFSIPLRDM